MMRAEYEQNGQDACHHAAYTLGMSELAGLIQRDLAFYRISLYVQGIVAKIGIFYFLPVLYVKFIQYQPFFIAWS